MPAVDLLLSGIYTHYYFTRNPSTHSWRFNTEEEYASLSGTAVVKPYRNHCFSDLSQITTTRPRAMVRLETVDTWAFISLFTQMLDVDPKLRLTPNEGLSHCFITMEHLRNADSNYVTSAISVLEKSQQKGPPFTGSFHSCSSNGSSTTCGSDDAKTNPGKAKRTPRRNHNRAQKTGVDDPNETEEGHPSAATIRDRFTRAVQVLQRWITRFFSLLVRRTNSPTPSG